jgi:hypothetical protein
MRPSRAVLPSEGPRAISRGRFMGDILYPQVVSAFNFAFQIHFDLAKKPAYSTLGSVHLERLFIPRQGMPVSEHAKSHSG